MASSKLHSSIGYSVEDVYRAADSGKQLSDFDVTDEKGYIALLLAAKNNNIQAIRALIEAGVDLNVRSSDGSYTALSLAVDKGNTTAVRELLQHGAFLSCEKGIEGLDMAIENGFLDAIVKGEELLIKQNKENIMDGKTGVFQAFKKNRLDLVKDLVTAGSYISLMHESTYTFRNNNKVLLQHLLNDGIDINIVFKEKTALDMAILFDSTTCVEILIKSKVDVNFVNKNKWTPLHIAARKDEQIVKLLVDAGADVNAETFEGETPLHLAASAGDIKTIQHLVTAGGSVNCINNDGDSILMKAIKRSSNVKEICEYLVRSGSYVNIPNKFGVQPIVNIVDIDSLELMQLFIEHGADVNACDSMGRSILSLAMWRRKKEITNLLLLKGADVNFMFNGEVPLLVMAVKLGDVELVKTMLKMGADITKADTKGNTPLHAAVDEFKFHQSWKSCLENRDQFLCVYSKEGVKLHLTPHDYIKSNKIVPQEFPSLCIEKCCDLVKILIKAGADVKISSESGIQPIVNILDFDNQELVELCLQHGADINSCDSNGRSVLSLSVWNRKEEIASLLVLNGADVNFMFNRQIPVLAMAVRLGYVELVQKMLEMGADVTKTAINGNNPLHDTVRGIVFHQTLKSSDVSHSTCSCNKVYETIAIKRHVNLPSLENTTQEDNVSIATRLEIVKILILAGSNINQVNNKLQSPLHIAIEQNIFVKDKHTKDLKHKINSNQMQLADRDGEDIRLDHPSVVCAEHGIRNQLTYNTNDDGDTVTIERKAYLKSLEYNVYKENIAIKTRLKILKILVEAGCNVNQVNSELESPFHLAPMGDKEIVQMFIEAGADVNSHDKNGHSALHRAIKSRHFENIIYIIKSGANVKARNEFGIQPIVDILELDDQDLVKLFIGHGADVNACDSNKLSILALALKNKKIEIAQLLVLNGADVNFMIDGRVPLIHLAVKLGNVELIMKMLEVGADVTQTDNNGNTPLHVALIAFNFNHSVKTFKQELLNKEMNPSLVSEKSLQSHKNTKRSETISIDTRLEILEILIKAGCKVNQVNNKLESALHLAIKYKTCVNILIKSGAVVNLANNKKQMPLHLAATGDEEIVKMLIEAGAVVNTVVDTGVQEKISALKTRRKSLTAEANFALFTNKKVRFKGSGTPLHIAARYGNINTVKLIVSAGGSVNALDTNGDSVLHKAIESRNVKKIIYLVAIGAKVYIANKAGEMPIVGIVDIDSIKLLKLFLAHGADVNSCDSHGNSVLSLALLRCKAEIANFLIDNGANVNDRLNGNRPVLFKAVELGDSELVKKMIESGANITKTDREGNTPLHVAICSYKQEGEYTRYRNADYTFNKNSFNKDFKTKHKSIRISKEYMHGIYNAGVRRQREIVDIFIKAGLSVNQLNNYLANPLCLAIKHKKLVDLLIKSKADVNLTGRNKQTALHLAASGPDEIVKMLINAGADVNAEIQTTDTTSESDIFYKAAHSYSISTNTSCTSASDDNDDAFLSDSRQLRNDQQLCKQIIGPNFTTSFYNGETPLHIAARSGYTNSLKYLVTAGASVNAIDKNGKSVLFRAIESKSIEKIKYLVEAGANVNVPDKQGILPIVNIFQFDSIELVKQFVKHGADLTACDRKNNSLLAIALNRKCKDIARFMVENGADVNVYFDGQVSALIMALKLDDMELVKKMVQNGADVITTDEDRNTLLHLAFSPYKQEGGYSQYNDKHFFQSDFEHMHKSIQSYEEYMHDNSNVDVQKQYEIADIFIKAGLSVNQLNNKLENPLCLAIKHKKLVELLIKSKADVNLTGRNKETALHLAASGPDEIVKMLIDAGADVNAEVQTTDSTIKSDISYTACGCSGSTSTSCTSASADNDDQFLSDSRQLRHIDEQLCKQVSPNFTTSFYNGETPLHIAARSGEMNAIKHLVTAGASVNALDKNGTSVLFKAIESNSIETIMYLVEAGANVNIPDKNGVLPIVKILQFDSIELVKLFVKHGADLTACDGKNDSVLTIALNRKCKEIAMFLIESGADVNVLIDGHVPALITAVKFDDVEMVIKMIENGANVTQTDRDGNTPLHVALSLLRYSKIERFLYNYHGNRASLDKKYFRASFKRFIGHIVDFNDKCVELVKILLEADSPVNRLNNKLESPLHLAIHHKQLVELLIKSKPDVNLAGKHQLTPLHLAATGEEEIVKMLIEAGADVNAETQLTDLTIKYDISYKTTRRQNRGFFRHTTEPQMAYSATAYKNSFVEEEKFDFQSYSFHNYSVKPSDISYSDDAHSASLSDIEQLIRHNKKPFNEQYHNITTSFYNGETPLHIAARSGEMNAVKHLVSAGASVNALDKNRKSVLCKAIESKSIEKIMYLVEAGANVNVQDKHGVLPIVNILQFNSVELVKQFVKYGAELTACDRKNNSLLAIALNRKCKDIANFMVEIGADVNVVFDGHIPALSMAVMLDYVELVKTMIKHGASVTKTDNYGNTPLHVALSFGFEKATSLKYLPRFIREEDKYFRPVLAYERFCNQGAISLLDKRSELVEVLIEAGSNINQKNNKLESPVHIYVKVYTNRKRYNKTVKGDRCTNILTLLIKHGAELSNSILRYCLLNRHIDHVGDLLKNSGCHFVDENLKKNIPNISLNEVDSIFSKRQFETLQMLVYNGIVLGKTQKKMSGKTISLTSLMLSIMYRHVDLAKYLLATCYMNVADLRQLRQFDKYPEELQNILCVIDKQPTVSTYELQTLIHEVVSQPWPLVKLAFITVSTMLGEGPKRDERLSQTNLPPKLKQSLNFESPFSFLPVTEWSKIQLCFDPVVYETLPRPRPLLYYWPTGLETPVAHISFSEGSNIPQFLETALDDATPEYSLKCWSLDASHVYMKCRLTRLKQYTENQKEQLSIHHERHLAEVVLKAAYDIRHRQQRFNDKQREELDPLVECCVDSLNACIYYHSTSFDADYGPEYLVLRSGLQFMIEDFESLEFEYDDEDSDFKENITSFTECLETWKKRFGLSDFFNNITHTAEELRRPKGIPAEHTWWF